MQRMEKVQDADCCILLLRSKVLWSRQDGKFIPVFKTYIYQNSPPISIAYSIVSYFFLSFFFCQYNNNYILDLVELLSLSSKNFFQWVQSWICLGNIIQGYKIALLKLRHYSKGSLVAQNWGETIEIKSSFKIACRRTFWMKGIVSAKILRQNYHSALQC